MVSPVRVRVPPLQFCRHLQEKLSSSVLPNRYRVYTHLEKTVEVVR
jgi:hypothetical protein